MKLSPIVLAIAMLGMSGNLQAAKTTRKGSNRVHKAQTARKAETTKKAAHKVKRGETAAKIASQHDLTLDELAALNPRVRLSKLSVGTTLHVAAPRKSAAPRVATRKAPSLHEAAPELPVTPRIAPTNLAHMERMLPASLRRTAPEAHNAPSPGVPLGDIRPILPQTPVPSSAALPSSTFEPANPDKLDLLWPVETRTVSSEFGPRMRTRTVLKVKGKRKRKVKVRFSGRHQGIDLNAPTGTDVYAALDGQVVSAGYHRQYGNFVVVDHGNGVTTLYAHHSANFAQEGDIVHRGQKIAAVGSTGRSTGPHLHFEVRLDGLHRDPMPYLNEDEEISAEMMAQNRAMTTER
ncbi:LysM peptidoglycan-binding domain-containing M23 family metallopeptidase [Holophaga foetida]|uniref:LysM peptidoglycan-binding domain-containing M23 family metallopeptidase n=1 Tax=Holophaga foetida TaxID=35839 RepID=UPI000247212D|nr:M23 family metallopeptidase [Holophaga foetida]